MTTKSDDGAAGERNTQPQAAGNVSPRTVETARPSDMARGHAGRPSSPTTDNAKYAGEPGPAGIRGENHMDPVREKRED